MWSRKRAGAGRVRDVPPTASAPTVPCHLCGAPTYVSKEDVPSLSGSTKLLTMLRAPSSPAQHPHGVPCFRRTARGEHKQTRRHVVA